MLKKALRWLKAQLPGDQSGSSSNGSSSSASSWSRPTATPQQGHVGSGGGSSAAAAVWPGETDADYAARLTALLLDDVDDPPDLPAAPVRPALVARTVPSAPPAPAPPAAAAHRPPQAAPVPAVAPLLVQLEARPGEADHEFAMRLNVILELAEGGGGSAWQQPAAASSDAGHLAVTMPGAAWRPAASPPRYPAIPMAMAATPPAVRVFIADEEVGELLGLSDGDFAIYLQFAAEPWDDAPAAVAQRRPPPTPAAPRPPPPAPVPRPRPPPAAPAVEDCSICQEPLLHATVTGRNCMPGHRFHSACMDKWKAASQAQGRETSCPVCRRPV